MLENYVVIDLEMTGLNAKTDKILEVGAVRVREGCAAETFGTLICQKEPLSPKITELTGITDAMAQEGRNLDEALNAFMEFLGEEILVGQNVIFDYSFLKQWAVNHSRSFERQAADTLKLARKFLPREQKKDLESLCRYFGIAQRNAHRALDDAYETHLVFEKLKACYGAEHGEDFVPKPLLYKAKKQSPATEHQKKYLRAYAAHYGIALPKDPDGLTKSEASRMTDRLILQYGKMPAGKCPGGTIPAVRNPKACRKAFL